MSRFIEVFQDLGSASELLRGQVCMRNIPVLRPKAHKSTRHCHELCAAMPCSDPHCAAVLMPANMRLYTHMPHIPSHTQMDTCQCAGGSYTGGATAGHLAEGAACGSP